MSEVESYDIRMKIKKMTEKQTAKGVKKLYVKQNVTHENYRRCINGESIVDLKQNAEFNLIRPFKHQLTSIKVNKSSLVAYDDKAYLLNAKECLPYGHKSIKKN